MFAIEFGGGLAAGSSALMADSVDNLGDAFVYALSLFALARGPRWEAAAALTKGVIILAFGVAVIVELGLKIAYGVPPSSRSEEHTYELQSLMRISYAGLCLKTKTQAN